MTPSAIKAEAKEAGLPASIKLPTVAVAGKEINTGGRARAFATIGGALRRRPAPAEAAAPTGRLVTAG